jgi:D-tyrosyl-tRNA(Tyr) deacylase
MAGTLRALVQRVSSASVTVEGELVGAIDGGLLILLGVGKGDGDAQVRWLADKVANLRIFQDASGKMNDCLLDPSCRDKGMGALVVSQFTLYGDCRKGRRPSFVGAAPPEEANRLYEGFCQRLRENGVCQVETGVFQAMMDVALVNDGPVTLMVETP